MGEIRKYGKHRYWTEEELQKLRRLSKKKSSNEIAKILGRTKASVEYKRQREKIECCTSATDNIIAKQVGYLVGQHEKSIYNRWTKAGLPLKKFCTRYKVISEEDLVEFMQEHHELWRASQCDYEFFCRYDWFIERLNAEKNGTDVIDHHRRRKEWTSYELSRVKMLWKKGLTPKEIAEIIGRSKMAVYHKIRRFENEEWGKC